MSRWIIGAALVGIISLHAPIVAQEAFEAASIKRSEAWDPTKVVPGEFMANGRWVARGATLSLLLRSAYGLPSNRVIGMPTWAYDVRFDINTTSAPNKSLKQLQRMAQQLLSDRFGLRAHLEQRINEVSALVRVNESGPLGPWLRPSVSSCERSNPSAVVSPATNDGSRCGEAITSKGGTMRLQLRDRPLADFLIISGARVDLGEPVVDRTALSGKFDIDLEFVPLALGPLLPEFGVPLRQAIVDQLGLRFERRQELVDVLMIERVTMPSMD